jgi:hypothetical protein
MKKTAAVFSAIALSLGMLSSGVAAQASTQEVTGVSAYYRVDLGYKVGWETPSNRSGVTGYVVTANPGGKTCKASKSAKECTFRTRDLGFTEQYTFTVATMKRSSVLATSEVSNPVSARSIPLAPSGLVSEAVSDTQIDVAWVPNSHTGGAALYGYRVTYWKSNTGGSPITDTKVETIVTEPLVSLTVEPETMYIIDVASCNAYGCNSADNWTYANTGATDVTLPRVISGGNASTTCFESIYDANAGETSVGVCESVVADPSTYPVVDPNATSLNIELPTKFTNRATLSFRSRYSLSTWGPIGISWFPFVKATSKSVSLGFETEPTVYSTTPSVCEVVGSKVQLLSTGRCTIKAYVEGNGVFQKSNTANDTIIVTN